MKISDVIDYLEKLAPLEYAEDFDNTGLLVGSAENKVTGVLVTLDTLEAVVEEAIEKDCNLIVSFHPIIFSGIKRLTDRSYVERAVVKAIKNDIAIYALHTALDNCIDGVNKALCDKLQINSPTVLIPKTNTIKKLVTYAPVDTSAALKQSLFSAGAGNIGNYEECSFTTQGIGSYKGNAASNPTIGLKERYHEEPESLISVIYEKHLEREILKALRQNHPYEEIAYEITTLENKNQQLGMGMIGELETVWDIKEYLGFVKESLNCGIIRHSELIKEKVKRVAILGGSGAFAIKAAISQAADLYISSDFKYHNFYEAEKKIVLADVGHYESEQFTKNLLTDYLSKKFTNFAVLLSTTTTNPVKYF